MEKSPQEVQEEVVEVVQAERESRLVERAGESAVEVRVAPVVKVQSVCRTAMPVGRAAQGKSNVWRRQQADCRQGAGSAGAE